MPLRNDYGAIEVTVDREKVCTGLSTAGAFIGDHTKSGLWRGQLQERTALRELLSTAATVLARRRMGRGADALAVAGVAVVLPWACWPILSGLFETRRLRAKSRR
jgi:hypothetical protein